MAEATERTPLERYGPAMSVQDEEAARLYLEALVVETMMVSGLSREAAVAQEKANLGYFAGYCDHETRLRVERLFDTVHPILGRADQGELTPQQVMGIGLALGESRRHPRH